MNVEKRERHISTIEEDGGGTETKRTNFTGLFGGQKHDGK